MLSSFSSLSSWHEFMASSETAQSNTPLYGYSIQVYFVWNSFASLAFSQCKNIFLFAILLLQTQILLHQQDVSENKLKAANKRLFKDFEIWINNFAMIALTKVYRVAKTLVSIHPSFLPSIDLHLYSLLSSLFIATLLILQGSESIANC